MIAIFPEIVAAANQGDLERLAVLARQYFGAGDAYAPRPDVAALLTYAGVGVEVLPLDTPGALVAKDERGAFKIVAIVAARRDEMETRFLLAHMLGHVLLDVLPVIARGDWQVSGLREVSCPLKRYAQGGADRGAHTTERREELADRFAAALLMPLGMVKRAHAKLQDTAKTAAFFGVPRACLERRLVDVGLATAAPVNFLDAERTLGAAAAPGADEDRMEAERAGLSAPEPSMPRSYAASTYGQTERSTRRDGRPSAKDAGGKAPPAQPTAAPKPPAAAPAPASGNAGGLGKGMDRIRELARRLEKQR